MRKLATKLTPAIKAWIKNEFGTIRYKHFDYGYFHWHNSRDISGINLFSFVQIGYTEVSEQEFLAEFEKPKVIIQMLVFDQWVDLACQEKLRIKPTPDYSKEIEALQQKAKENGMKVTVNFEKL